MRAGRWLTVGAVLGALFALPSQAAANGGAWISLDETHYLPGETAVAVADVSIPERRQDLLDRGPFYAFLVPNGVRLSEGRPIPDGAIRVATFAVEERRRDAFRLTASFTVPELPGDYYAIALCNDPCTLQGFGEPLSGEVSIVETEREGRLLTENAKLNGRIYGLRREVRKAERRLEDVEGQLGVASSDRSALLAEVAELERRLEAADREIASLADRSRPLIDGLAGALTAAVLMVAIVAALVGLVRRRWRRRRPEPFIPDAIEELGERLERTETLEVR